MDLSKNLLRHKKWPDWRLNPGPPGHIPVALTTELSGLTASKLVGQLCTDPSAQSF